MTTVSLYIMFMKATEPILQNFKKDFKEERRRWFDRLTRMIEEKRTIKEEE